MTNEKDNINYTIGGISSLLGAILGLVVAPILFLWKYQYLIDQEKAICPVGCEHIIGWFLPAYTDVAIIAGMLYLVSTYGFFAKEKWAIKTAMIANILALKTSFWPIIPSLDTGTTPYYLILFLPNVVLWFVIARYAGGISWGRILTGLFLGMGMVTTFMNGTSATNMFMKATEGLNPKPGMVDSIELFILVQRIAWLSAILMGIVCYYVLFKPDEKIRLLGISAGLLVFLYCIPLGIKISDIKGEFSMMLYSPMVVAVYMVVFLYPKFWNQIVEPVDLKG